MTSRAPYVAASDTSRARAAIEDADGTTQRLRDQITEWLDSAGPQGLTWSEIGAVTNYHHGQISGALSTMHKHGEIVQLRTIRNRCHPYIHCRYADLYNPNELNYEPVKTRGNAVLDVADELAAAVHDLRHGRGDMAAKYNRAWDALDAYRTARGPQ